MKLMKSFLTLLLLGGMTLAGCNKDAPKDNTPSGEEGGGGSGGGDNGGGSGGGSVATDYFTGKKIIFDSMTVDSGELTPQQQESTEASLRNQYAAFFSDGTFEFVSSQADHYFVDYGPFTLSEDKTVATATLAGYKDASGDHTFSGDTMTITYSTESSKYHTVYTMAEVVVSVYFKDSGEAASHFVFPTVSTVTVSFNANASDATGTTASIDAVPGQAFALPVCGFERDGFTFVGWSPVPVGGNTYAAGSIYSVNADATLYAIWEAETVNKTTQYIETKSWFNAGNDSEHVYVYAYKDGADPMVENAPFPGEEAIYIRDIADGKKIFSYDIAEAFDTFVVTRVDGETNSYQTVDISIASLEGDNCIYLVGDAAPASVDTKINVGHYNYTYEFGLSATSGTIVVGGHTDVIFVNVTGEVSYTVAPEGSATVVINEGVATISASATGTPVITFSDESGKSVDYTLTVNEAPTSLTVYFQTKQFFNSGADNENVLAYCYDSTDGDNVNNTWPGEAMTWIEDQDNNQKIFGFVVDLTQYDTVMFVKTVDNEATLKTVEIAVSSFTETDNCVYLDANDWSDANTGISVGFFTYTVPVIE